MDPNNINDFSPNNPNENPQDYDSSNNPRRIREIAEELVKKILKKEPWPDRVDAPDGKIASPDLFSLFSALTALQQEVALQGRSFGRLDQNLERVISYSDQMKMINENVLKLNQNLHQVHEVIASLSSRTLSEMREMGKEEARKEFFDSWMDPLLDTHDQMRRLVEQYKIRLHQLKGWRGWLGRRRILTETYQTQSICETKIRQKLEALGISLTTSAGIQFDPKCMKAVDVEYQPDQSPDVVLELYRQGYRLGERILRFAEVKVSGREDPKTNHA
ncbi:MAG: nucleotide exchange factor GrpE [Candidatus Hinthialibacter sp.]